AMAQRPRRRRVRRGYAPAAAILPYLGGHLSRPGGQRPRHGGGGGLPSGVSAHRGGECLRLSAADARLARHHRRVESPVVTVTAARALFGNLGAGGESWVTTHASTMALVWPLLITAVFAPLAVRRFARLSR